jgi:hypothetical protein
MGEERKGVGKTVKFCKRGSKGPFASECVSQESLAKTDARLNKKSTTAKIGP